MPNPQLEEDYSTFQDQVASELFSKLKQYPRSDEWTTKWTRKFLAGSVVEVKEPLIDQARFDTALAMDSYEAFRDIIKTIPRESLFTIHRVNKLKSVVTDRSKISGRDHEMAVSDLKEVVGVEDEYPGICIVSTPTDSRAIGSEGSEKIFSLHSIGKVFTGVLIAEMIARGIIPEEELTRVGLQLDSDVKDALPEAVQMKIDEASLHQVMTHRASLGDYLGKYLFEELNEIVESGRLDEVPMLREPQDFLRYASDEVKDNSYSNLGILLAGLAAQHYYNKGKAPEDQKSYSEILRELVLEPAGLEDFSATPPADGLFSDENIAQRYVCGSPAGGYWASAKDMQKFADHLCDRMKDEKFYNAVIKYGQEFYSESDQTIRHAGELRKSSAWFSVHVPSRTSCIMAQNDDFAGMVGHQVSMVIASEQERQRAAAPQAASIVFLLGTSTAGKSTICAKLEKSGWDVYGVDEDLANDESRCEGLLSSESIPEFQKMKDFIESGVFPKSSFHPFDKGTMGLLFALCDVDKYLEENTSLDEEVKIVLKSLAKKNPDFKEKAGFNFDSMQQRIFDHAIEKSKMGISVIIDGSDGMRERFEEYAAKLNHNCSTSVALVHLPIPELAKRMEARNLRALETGDLSNQRSTLRPFEQYADFFGANCDTKNLAEEELSREEVVFAASKFGQVGDDVKLYDKLGFEEGQDSILVGVKIKVDAVFDHAKMTTSEIAKGIKDLSAMASHFSSPSPSPSPEYSTSLRSGAVVLEPEKKPLYIFIGESHADFSYTDLSAKLVESCKAKGLRVVLCQEIPSRIKDVTDKGYIEKGDAKYFPDNWQARASELESDPAFVKEFHDRRKVAREFFETYRSQGKSLSEIIDYWRDHVSSELLDAEIAKAREAGVDFDMVETDPVEIEKMGDEASEYNKNFFNFIGIFNWHLCLSEPEIASDMASRIETESEDKDVIIICTGSAHSANIVKRLGVEPSDMVMVSNESDLPDVIRFGVDDKTHESSIPDVLEERLAEKQAEVQTSKATQPIHSL